MPRLAAIVHGAAEDRPDEADTIAVAADIEAALKRLGFVAETHLIGLDLSPLEAIAACKPEVVFNLVEALCGDDALAALVPLVLDHLGLAYTGSGALAHQLVSSKLLTKERLRAHGLQTPDWWIDGARVPESDRVIVKSATAHASFGLDPGSVVLGAQAASEIAARERRFGGSFFAERYMTGREFNIAVLERGDMPAVLPIPEIEFVDWPADRARIVDYDAKWNETSPAYRHSQRRFGLEAREPALARELSRLALACWRLFALAGYARIDVRLDEYGAPHILEVNLNPCLARDAGFVATSHEAGLSFDDLIAAIIAAPRCPRGPKAEIRQPAPSAFGAKSGGWRDEVTRADIARIRALVYQTRYFTPAETDIAAELVEERLAKGSASGYEFLLLERESELVGYACYGKIAGTDASYDLYWIAVAPHLQAKGVGKQILMRVERRIAAAGGTRLYADTSSSERYASTRGFYERAGFKQSAMLEGFYREGDGKVIYEKLLAP